MASVEGRTKWWSGHSLAYVHQRAAAKPTVLPPTEDTEGGVLTFKWGEVSEGMSGGQSASECQPRTTNKRRLPT